MLEVFHKSYAQTPEGLLIIADGVNAARRWDGLAASTETAGVIAPTAALTIRQSGKGPIRGTYYGYSRFKDTQSLVSNLSPISAAFRTYHAGRVFSATNTTPIAIGATVHGLTSGDKVQMTNVQGTTAANGAWTVTVHDNNNFSLNGSVGNGAHTAETGTWVGGLTAPPAMGVCTTINTGTPRAIGSFAHSLVTGAKVRIRGSTEAVVNANWTITRVDDNNFSLDGSSGGTVDNSAAAYWTATQVTPTSGSVIGAQNASPISIGSLQHGLTTGDSVTIEDVEGNTAANGTFTITVVDVNNFTLNSSTGNGGYSRGGTWKGGVGPPFHGFTLSNATFATPIVVTSVAHGLATGDWVTVTGVRGNTSANGAFEVQRNGDDTFTLVSSIGNAAYTAGGFWTAAARYIQFSSVPVSAEAKVTRRQVLRNTTGQTDTFYVDLDTTDLSDTILESPLEDTRLDDKTAVPLLDSDGNPLANANTVPPDHKSTLAHHNGRMFYAGEVAVRQGHVQVTNGSTTVTGIATNFKSTLANRAFYAVGDVTKYTISSVNTAAQTLTLSASYTGTTDKFAVYSIRPQPVEHRLIYYSEANKPESVPVLNAIRLAENDDEIVGMLQAGSFLFFIERHHLWRFSMQSNPAVDGFAWPIATRGAVNNRCYAIVGETVYMLDTDGIYSFTGNGDVEPSSLPIQNIFRPSDSPYIINWQSSNWFHCSQYPNQETIRWFVCLSGHQYPRHAIVYNYRRDRWWIEEFNRPITSSVVGTLNGGRVVFLGTDAKTTLAMWQGSTDGPDPDKGTIQGTATAGTPLTISMTGSSFPTAGVIGNPVCIVDGTGKGQTRRASALAGNGIIVSNPWFVLPNTTSVFQLGGIPWSFQTGFFRYVDDSQNSPTRVEVIFKPQTAAALATLKVFHDYSKIASTWTGTLSSAENNGVRITSGSADLVFDLTKSNGYIDHRMDRHRDEYIDGTHYVSIGLSGVGGKEPTSIYEMTIDGASK